MNARSTSNRILAGLICASALALGACGGGGDGGSMSTTEICAQMTEITQAANSLDGQLAPAGKAQYESLASKTHQAADGAPSEISDALDDVASSFDKLAAGEAISASDDAAVTAADQVIGDWASANCD